MENLYRKPCRSRFSSPLPQTAAKNLRGRGTAKDRNKKKRPASVFIFCFFIIIIACIVLFVVLKFIPKNPMDSDSFNFHEFIKCKSLFVFGDSTVDSGTSNITEYPYGIDFDNGTTRGRFSNGKTSADYLASWMEKPLPVPFKKNTNMMPNIPISFASGGCGILNTTRLRLPLTCFSFREQIEQFLSLKFLPIDANDLFFFSIGSNDFIFSDDLNETTSQVFVKQLTSEYVTYLQRLYSFGAKKFLVNNIGPIGCIPDKRNATDHECNDNFNEAVRLFNAKLVKTLKKFVKDFGVEVVLIDCDVMFSLFLKDAQKYGFEFVHKPCCGTWNEGFQGFECNGKSALCEDRDLHIFFDGAHPSDRANFHFIKNCVSGTICRPVIATD